MSKFKQVSSQVNFFTLEEETLKYWKEKKIFEKSISIRPEDKTWNFLDGPPFVTGMPHYGSLLSSMPKDLFGRYWTMKGYRVRRVWGWDGHGLPIENKVENKLGIKRKKDIEEKVGVARFIKECLGYVNQISSEWEWYIDHIGRWVDFKNAYKTWDINYMESVMWVFKQMYDKELIYKGLRVSLYCPHCVTPISNFEVAMDTENYKTVTEPATTYKYQLKGEENTYLLAWSTTPWNKLATPALAVNPKLDYVKVKQGEDYYILGKKTLAMLKDEPYKILEEFKGEKLVGKEFVPSYDYYKIEPGKRAFVVIPGDFVTEEEGTGVVTIAAYGEEDLAVMKKENIQVVLHVDDEGFIKSFVPKFAGMYYLDANEAVNKDLAERGFVYDEKPYTHSVAYCWRCATRLIYSPKDAWFVDVQQLKPKMFKNNEAINWFPKHFKYGRFAKSMEAAPDWNISRNRYWGSPVPVWECECGERIVPGSIAELEKLSGQKITNLHKPEIDEVKIKCPKCDKKATRVPEVLDSWIEAGSASFAERHFPFEKDQKLEDFFPPDFIAEYTGQIRAWFYVIHVISSALYDSPGFKNVLVEGVLLGNDGRKMSKNYSNFPDPKNLIEQYGGDALRIYLMGSPLMKGEDIDFSNDGVPEVTRGFFLILWNSYKYFIDYAVTYDWDKDESNIESENYSILDKWILTSLEKVVSQVSESLDSYDTLTSIKLLRSFIVDDFSTWYIRRSRDRVNNNSDEKDRSIVLNVMYTVLVKYSQLLAPLAPFISEEIFRSLSGGESVHLTDYPKSDKSLIDEDLISQMSVLRKLAEMGHAQRKDAGIKLRQPLAKFTYFLQKQLNPELETVLSEELNVKQVVFKKHESKDIKGEIDIKISPELQAEGDTRELIRQIQSLRKTQGLTLKDQINITVPTIPEEENLKQLILKQTNAKQIKLGDSVEIEVV
ncbi:MAG: isoleucine--tRNA ligase [Candidatus Daviesbacteria bacterium]|nr:isoleucine--tRNA ligase [Candidatus Daviesbacteria bacterium]